MMSSLRILLMLLVLVAIIAGNGFYQYIRFQRQWQSPLVDEVNEPTNWALLVAGSYGWPNYRHQADVCHAYQILKRGGLKDENIVVFMYDDVAWNYKNPMQGKIFNHPNGEDVYAGVPKDYTGQNVTFSNIQAVLHGDVKKVKGGSGKVINSKSGDRIFFFFSSHGLPQYLILLDRHISSEEFIGMLSRKHTANTYKSMVIYMNACYSGSLFENNTLHRDLNIYVITACNATEPSYGTYCPCPWTLPCHPSKIRSCLGNIFSVAWLEDSETHNLKKRSIAEQYKEIKKRTSNFSIYIDAVHLRGRLYGSHPMEFGDKNLKTHKLSLYQGFDPKTENLSVGLAQ